MKKTRERFSISAKKAGFVLACTLIPFSMLNGTAQTAANGTQVKDVTSELKDSETIVLPPQAAGTTEPVEFRAADKEPAEKKNVYENSGKEAEDFAASEEKSEANAASKANASSASSPATASPKSPKSPTSTEQTTTIVEPPYTTTKVTTETVTTKTVTTETRTTESSFTAGPGLPPEERVDGPLAPVQQKHSWDNPAPKSETKATQKQEKKQEPEANLRIKETEPKKKPEPAKKAEAAKQPATKTPSATQQTQRQQQNAAQPARQTPSATQQNANQNARQPQRQNAAQSEQQKAAPARTERTPDATAGSRTQAPAKAEPAQRSPASSAATPAQNAPQKQENSRPAAPVQDETPSRSATLKNGQYLDVVYPGTGWIYLGEKDANDLMRYYGRKVSGDGEETSFSLKATKSGNTVLHFYKNDALTGKFIEDYLAVSVSTENEQDTHVSAPNYADYVPKGQRGKNLQQAQEATSGAEQKATERPARREEETARPQIAASSSTGTSIERTSTAQAQGTEPAQRTAPRSPQAASGDLLKKAQGEYDAKQYAECLATLSEFYKNADEAKMDQALYLEGRALEAPSPSRNIKSALQTYKTLVNRYPQSSLWEAANNRITYIQRMYIDIR